VSDGGEVKEAALWWGELATARRRATLLPGGHTLTDTASRTGTASPTDPGSPTDPVSLTDPGPLTDPVSLTDAGPLADTATGAPVGPLGGYLYEPDGAVIRAGLVAEVAVLLGARLLDRTIAYLTVDHPVTTPFATGYAVLEAMPFSLKRLRALLHARGAGAVTVKKRGSPVDPALLRRELRLSGSGHATVVLTRVSGAPTVLLVERL
jgi:hypothetical protein